MTVDIPNFTYPVQGFRKFGLKNINFNLFVNDSIGILGESGSGKSTLLKLLAGLLPLETKNQILIYDNCMGLTALKDIKRHKRYGALQIVFQDNVGSLYPDETIKSAIKHIANIKRVSKQRVKENARHFFQLLGLIKSDNTKNEWKLFLHKKISNLSMGMLRRFCLAKAVLLMDIYTDENQCFPKVMLLDEISRGLDAETKKLLIHFIKELIENYHISIIAISHELTFLQSICTDFYFLFEGLQLPLRYKSEDLNNPETITNPYVRSYFIPCVEPQKPDKTMTDAYETWQNFRKYSKCIFLHHFDCPEKNKQKCTQNTLIYNDKEKNWICS